MSCNIKIDLHMHSAVSDGTDTPEELVRSVRNAGLRLFSLTDHDAVKGCKKIRGILSGDDPLFITGAEFSCRDEEGRYHILGYGYDPDSASVSRIIEAGHSNRIIKLKARLEFIETEFGFVFSQEDVSALYALDNPGKPHIANLMVRYGYTDTKETAIRDYLDRLRLPDWYLRPEEAIDGIIGGGGIPVLAHPAYGSGDQLILGDDMDRRIRRLMGFGLKGVEAYYSGFTDKIRGEILDFADRYDLYVTAGSDYHGKNKMISLGDTGLADLSEATRHLIRFLEDTGVSDILK